MAYLPGFYAGIREMEKLQDTIGTEVGALYEAGEDALGQRFVESATWGLSRWEAELGLVTDHTVPVAGRREMIKAKMRGAGTTTAAMLERTASAFSGGDVRVEEVPGEYRFILRFVGTLGIPPNMAGLIQTIEEIKPAHLAYEFAYTYTWWNTVRHLNWNQAGEMTWNGMKAYG